VIARRHLLIAVGPSALASAFASFAQQSAKAYRIGFLEGTSPARYRNRLEALRAGLRDLGYVEGKNIVIEFRWAEGHYERLAGLAAELVQSKADVIVAGSPPAVQAMKQATSVIPIVMLAVGDPVGAGFVESLAKPGGNITGLSNINVGLSSKYLELLVAAVPKISRVAVLVNPGHPTHPESLRNIQAYAKAASVAISPMQAASATQVEAAIAAIAQPPASALIVLPDPLFLLQAPRIAELAAKKRLPTMFWTRELAEAGGLMSYGANLPEQFRRAATYVDKILRNTRPQDLPVEQPTTFELVVNRKTASELGLSLSRELLLRADEVIQ
jgi:putative tryptophan/tyrosine transport system substrate-binding protein